MMQIRFLIVLFFISTFNSFGQDSNTVSNFTNRLGFVEGTRAIREKGLLAEINYSHSQTNYYRSGWVNPVEILERQQTFPKINLGYGVANGVSIRFGIGLEKIWQTTEHWEKTYFFVNDISFGSTINLSKQKGIMPELALLVDLKFQLSGNYGLGVDVPWDVYGLVGFAWKYEIVKPLKISGNFKYNGFNRGLLWGTKLNYEPINHLGIFTSVQASSWGLFDLQVELNGGLYYRFNSRIQIDLQGYHWIEYKDAENSNRNAFAIGFSWLFS